MKSLSSSWLNKIGSEDFEKKLLSFKSSCSSKFICKFSLGTSGSSLKIDVGISSQWATGRSAEGRFGYITDLRFSGFFTVKLIAQK